LFSRTAFLQLSRRNGSTPCNVSTFAALAGQQVLRLSRGKVPPGKLQTANHQLGQPDHDDRAKRARDVTLNV
jgi:hypothetical protein